MGGAAAAFLLDEAHNMPKLSVPNIRTSTDQALAQHLFSYAESALSRKTTASITLRLANFQQFLLLSACAVLRAQKGLEPKVLCDIVRILTGSETDRHCRRMMDTAVYINELIDTLSACGWDDRAAVLILLCSSPKNIHPMSLSG
jgi:hypothetical protein